MPQGITLQIECELGANAYKIEVRKHRIFAGWLIGYMDHRTKLLKCYPFKKMERGTFAPGDLPIVVRYDELPWIRRA